MVKTRSEQKKRNEGTSKNNSQIIKIRDWLGFFFTVVGVCLSLSGSVHIDIQIQYNTVIEVYDNFPKIDRTRWFKEDFFLDLKDGTDSTRKNNTGKPKYPIEWTYIDISEYHQDIFKRKKRTITHIFIRKNNP